MKLKNKNIIVTGGSSGIGKAVAAALVAKGATVGVFDVVEHSGKDIDYYEVDVGNHDQVVDAVQRFFEKHGVIDGLVNNAAVLKDGMLVSVFGKKVSKYSLDDWNATLNTNLNGVFYMTQEVVEKMVLKRTRGVVVNVSSISAAGNLGQTSYAASKAAVNALTTTWARELSLLNIRVAGVAPGMTDTTMPRAMKNSVLQEWVEKTAVKRMGSPEEVAAGIVFALENDFFCGRVLELDGGLRM